MVYEFKKINIVNLYPHEHTKTKNIRKFPVMKEILLPIMNEEPTPVVEFICNHRPLSIFSHKGQLYEKISTEARDYHGVSAYDKETHKMFFKILESYNAYYARESAINKIPRQAVQDMEIALTRYPTTQNMSNYTEVYDQESSVLDEKLKNDFMLYDTSIFVKTDIPILTINHYNHMSISSPNPSDRHYMNYAAFSLNDQADVMRFFDYRINTYPDEYNIRNADRIRKRYHQNNFKIHNPEMLNINARSISDKFFLLSFVGSFDTIHTFNKADEKVLLLYYDIKEMIADAKIAYSAMSEERIENLMENFRSISHLVSDKIKNRYMLTEESCTFRKDAFHINSMRL